MKRLINLRNIICLYILWTALFTYAEKYPIYTPVPKIHLTFDNSGNLAFDNMRAVSGTLMGSCESMPDRFGKSNRAIKFKGLGAAIRFENITISSINTTSFWAYVSDPSSIPVGSTPYAKSDLTKNFYNWTDSNNKILRGLARKKATVGFNRYITKDDGSRVPWYLWSYAPAQFDQSGWYHIFVVQGAYYTRMIMYKPGGQKVYSYNWLGAQSFNDQKYLYIGGLPSQYGFENSFDDFKLYEGDLSDDVIDALHVQEYPIGRPFRLINSYSNRYLVSKGASTQDFAEIIQHDSHSGNGVWTLQSAGGTNEYRLINSHSNKYLVVQDASNETGAKIIQHYAPTTNSIWILEKVDKSRNIFQLRNKNSGKYLSLSGNVQENGATAIQGESHSAYSGWYFAPATPIMENLPITNGLYRLKNKNSGKYLDINLADYGATNIVQKEGSPIKYSNIWSITKSSKNSFFIQNIVDDKFLIGPAGNDNLANITEGNNTPDSNRDLWQFIPTNVEGEYEIRNLNNYNYMVVKHASSENDAEVVQWSTGETNNAIWKLEKYFYSDSPLHHGWYSFRNLNSYKLLVVKDASLFNYASIIQHRSGGDNSIFEVSEEKWGTVTLQNKNSGKYIVVQHAALGENAPIIQYEGKPSANGLWVVTHSYMPDGAGYEFRNLRSGLVLSVANASQDDFAQVVQANTELEESTWIPLLIPQPRSEIQAQPTIAKINLENGLLVNVSYTNDIIAVSYDTSIENTNVQVQIVDLNGNIVYKDSAALSDNVADFTGFVSSVNKNTLYIIEVTVSDGARHVEKLIF